MSIAGFCTSAKCFHRVHATGRRPPRDRGVEEEEEEEEEILFKAIGSIPV